MSNSGFGGSLPTEAANKINLGTGAIRIVEHQEGSPWGKFGTIDQFQAISAQKECSSFSLEELRVADYKAGRGGAHTDLIGDLSATSFAEPLHKALIPDCKKGKTHLDLLLGFGFEVRVGTSKYPYAEDPNVYHTWSLPQALISRYSPFLKAACLRDFKERQEKRIELPEDDPAVFGLFVEWMYYGDYSFNPSLPFGSTSETEISIDAQCWVLGDKLLCGEFQNHAMSRLYKQFRTSFPSRAMTAHEFQYVCENTVAGSKLRQFYFAFVVEHFADPIRLNGTTEEWDVVLLEHSDAISFLLQSFRTIPGQRKLIKDETYYMDQVEPLSNEFGRMKIQGSGL